MEPRLFVLTVPIEEVELATDVVWQLGVRGVEERRVEERGVDGEVVELWTAVGERADAHARAVAAIAGRWPHRLAAPVAAADTWREFARPVEIADDLVVMPAWQTLPDDVEAHHALWIEPAGAFGLGDHPTTVLSLRSLRRAITQISSGRARGDGVSVLDVGCGTGALSIAAVRFGAGRVRAIDVSSAAVEATLDNAVRNDVAHAIEVDGRPLAEIEGPYDVVVANILAPTLIELAADLVRVTASTLVVSGVLDASHDHVLDALAPLQAAETGTLDGWAAVTLVR